MRLLISPFILYKPIYLSCTNFDINPIDKINFQYFFGKGDKNNQKNYSQINNAQIFEHIMKCRLSSSISGSICWHQSQLQDLLTMVQEFGMVHYF
jgi:hypothetical protein